MLKADADYGAARQVDVAIIAVPTPIDIHRIPDLSYIRSAAESLALIQRDSASVHQPREQLTGVREHIGGGCRPGG